MTVASLPPDQIRLSARAYLSLAIRTAADPHRVMGEVREALRQADPELAISRFSTASEALAGTIEKPGSSPP